MRNPAASCLARPSAADCAAALVVPCNSNSRIRLRLPSGLRSHSPGVSVACRPSPQSDSSQDEPVVVVEVLSPETRRIHQGEKVLACTTIPSLLVCLMVEQGAAKVVGCRR